MDTQIVLNWMTPNPITITLQTTLPEARQLMERYYIRRLPVVKKGKLVGIVTRGDIREAQSSKGTTLSVCEMNFFLDQLTAEEFMAYEPITIAPDATIEEAAGLMLQHKIGGLPVVENGELVGIITETDLCRVLLLQPEHIEEG
jgi:acetoin utilization protein AcuB